MLSVFDQNRVLSSWCNNFACGIFWLNIVRPCAAISCLRSKGERSLRHFWCRQQSEHWQGGGPEALEDCLWQNFRQRILLLSRCEQWWASFPLRVHRLLEGRKGGGPLRGRDPWRARQYQEWTELGWLQRPAQKVPVPAIKPDQLKLKSQSTRTKTKVPPAEVQRRNLWLSSCNPKHYNPNKRARLDILAQQQLLESWLSLK